MLREDGPVRVLGVDFTSRPQRSKPLAAASGRLEGDVLAVTELSELATFGEYETLLRSPGPWVAAVDHPFGLPRPFIEAVGWPSQWPACMEHVATLTRPAFREIVMDFKAPRPAGSKNLRRWVERQRVRTAASPLNVVNPPVGMMFLEGSPRLLSAGVTVLPCRPDGAADRVVLEGYPALVARELLLGQPYKDGGWRAGRNRQALLDGLAEGLVDAYGVRVILPEPWRTNVLLDDGGDLLDAVLCAVQAASACRLPGYGIPASADPLEGWIADPLTR